MDPSLQTSLLFLSIEAISSDNASASLDGDWEPTLEADLDDAIFPFPLPELKAVSALL
jgi:hypothetical protein